MTLVPETKPTVDPNDASGICDHLAVPYIQGGLKVLEPEFQSITLPSSMTDRSEPVPSAVQD